MVRYVGIYIIIWNGGLLTYYRKESQPLSKFKKKLVIFIGEIRNSRTAQFASLLLSLTLLELLAYLCVCARVCAR